MLARIDRLADLGTTIITLSGGEPTLHPDLDAIIARIRERGAIATLITNGLLLTPERIQKLNRAGLDYLQISIDNARPDEISKKSLQVLDRKLEWLAEHAEFGVTINSVLGAGIRNPGGCAGRIGAGTIARIHQHGRHSARSFRPIEAAGRGPSRGLRASSASTKARCSRSRISTAFSRTSAAGLPNAWHCRAGGRFLYICEDGLVHYCSQQRGKPGIPLEDYTVEDLRREAARPKGCAPFCTISCVHQTAMLDDFREKPRETLAGILERRREADPGFRPPVAVRALSWMFLDPRRRGFFGKLMLSALGIKRKPEARTSGLSL